MCTNPEWLVHCILSFTVHTHDAPTYTSIITKYGAHSGLPELKFHILKDQQENMTFTIIKLPFLSTCT